MSIELLSNETVYPIARKTPFFRGGDISTTGTAGIKASL